MRHFQDLAASSSDFLFRIGASTKREWLVARSNGPWKGRGKKAEAKVSPIFSFPPSFCANFYRERGVCVRGRRSEYCHVIFSTLVFQTSFRGETSGSVAKCGCFFRITISIFFFNSNNLFHNTMWHWVNFSALQFSLWASCVLTGSNFCDWKTDFSCWELIIGIFSKFHTAFLS